MGGCRRALESPRTIYKGKNTAIGHARLEEVGSPPEDSPPRRWQTVEIGARAGGLVDNPPVRFRPSHSTAYGSPSDLHRPERFSWPLAPSRGLTTGRDHTCTSAASALAAATSTIPIVAAPIGEAGLSELMGDMVRPTATSRA